MSRIPVSRIAKPEETPPGQYMARWRMHRLLPISTAAAKSGVPAHQIKQIEAGTAPYDQLILEKLGSLYGCKPNVLISLDPTKEFFEDSRRKLASDLSLCVASVDEKFLPAIRVMVSALLRFPMETDEGSITPEKRRPDR